MNFSTLKKLAVTSAVALTLYAGSAQAQVVSSSIGAEFRTAPALATAPGLDIDFGEWAVNVAGGDTFVIALDASTGVPALPACAGVVDANSFCANLTAPLNSGTVTVTSPIATTVQIQGAVTTDFTEGTLALTALTYTDTVVTNGTIPAAFDGTEITTTANGVAETIGIGGTLTISGGTPAAAQTFNDAVIDLDFQY